MYSSYEVDPVLEAAIPNLSWHVGYLWRPWGGKKDPEKPPCKAVVNKYPSAYVAMVHTLRNTAHKYNQALTTLAALLPACLSVFLYLIILLVHPNIRTFKKGKSLSFQKVCIADTFCQVRNATHGGALAA